MFKMRYFFLLISTLIVSFANAQQTKTPPAKIETLEWLEWNEGYPKAVQEGKIVLVDAYTEWCGWCKKMDRDTYSQQEVIKKINAHFVPIKFNPELTDKTYKIGDQTFTAAQLYGLLTQGNSTGFPTIYYIFPAKKRIMLDPGYKEPTAFLTILDHIMEESKK